MPQLYLGQTPQLIYEVSAAGGGRTTVIMSPLIAPDTSNEKDPVVNEASYLIWKLQPRPAHICEAGNGWQIDILASNKNQDEVAEIVEKHVEEVMADKPPQPRVYKPTINDWRDRERPPSGRTCIKQSSDCKSRS